ncbi:MAG: trypsin-like peptidase domain-containing protein [Lachnospiraceae bacterium]|nr:trypsin-like peptidase domain-containing protein [Lachnospiraceae bacterium]
MGSVAEKEAACRDAKEHDERKVRIMSSFMKKLGAGAVIGLAFGILAAFGFIGVTKVWKMVFPAKADVSAKIEADIDRSAGAEDESDKPDIIRKTENSQKVGNASLMKAVENSSTEDNGEVGMSVTQLAKNNLPCVVSITNTSVKQLRDMWGNGIREYEDVSRGSGIIIGQTDDELLIVTNSHVVNGADSITVGFVDSEIYDAVAKGEDSEIDLAVIGVKMSDIKKETLDEIKVAVIGDSDKLQVGEQVVAIGNAIGYGQSVTTGIVSALNRDIPDDDAETCYIQTDAAINPGNSGGALLNMKGEVIGINSAKIMSTYVEGMGYAIPMNVADPTIETLMNRKARDKVDDDKAGYLGITGVSVDSQTSTMYGIPEGIYLQEIIEDGPADEAGLHKGDIIKKFDGVSVSTIADLRSKLDYYEAGEKVDLIVCRQEDGEYVDKTFTITLSARKDYEKTSDDKDSDSDDKDSKKDEPDEKDDEKPGQDQSIQDYYEQLPDELKEFFFGFGR